MHTELSTEAKEIETEAESGREFGSALWMSSETRERRSCFAFLPKTKSSASITLDLPLPFGPTIAESEWCIGPTVCFPAYDLKFSSSISFTTSLPLSSPPSAISAPTASGWPVPSQGFDVRNAACCALHRVEAP
jgi:hypothetical protein